MEFWGSGYFMKDNEFAAEWHFLQGQFESYEKHSLYIKLFAIAVLLLAAISERMNTVVLLILLLLWLQDAIWKTFQSRIEPRLLLLERAIAGEAVGSALQFNTEYQLRRLSGSMLIKEYACQALRPTVAFPHVMLILIAAGVWVVGVTT